jgi:hypothetical protein
VSRQDPREGARQDPCPFVKNIRLARTQWEETKHQMSETATLIPAPQRLRALERANAVRLARAELKRRIAEGDASAAEVILEPPDEALSWAIGELLMSQRRWGTTRCRKFLARYHITETKTLGALTDRQRRLLAEELEISCAARPLALV